MGLRIRNGYGGVPEPLFCSREKIPSEINRKFDALLRGYLVVGGMPEMWEKCTKWNETDRVTPFCIKLADVVIRIEPMFDCIREYCREYITEEQESFTVRMMQNTRFYRLGCNMDPEAARVAFEGMNGGKQGEVDMEKYEAPELEIIRFESEDIITTSLAANELSILWEDDSGDFQ